MTSQQQTSLTAKFTNYDLNSMYERMFAFVEKHNGIVDEIATEDLSKQTRDQLDSYAQEQGIEGRVLVAIYLAHYAPIGSALRDEGLGSIKSILTESVGATQKQIVDFFACYATPAVAEGYPGFKDELAQMLLDREQGLKAKLTESKRLAAEMSERYGDANISSGYIN